MVRGRLVDHEKIVVIAAGFFAVGAVAGDVEAAHRRRPLWQQLLLHVHRHVERMPQPEPIAQIGDHAVQFDRQVAEFATAVEIGTGVQIARAHRRMKAISA